MADSAKPTVQVDPAGAAGAVDENAALVAELEAEQGGKPAKPVKPAKAPAAKDAKKPGKAGPAPAVEVDAEPDAEEPDAEPADDDAEPDEDTAADAEADDEDDLDADAEESDDDEEESDAEDEDDELDAESAKDPELVKRHAALRRTAERQRQRLELERATFDRERTTFQTETRQVRADVDRICGLAARAKIDPAAVLEALGLSPDDMEYAGQQCHARSKAAATDPRYRAAAERAIRDREAAETAAANAKRIAELEAKIEGKDSQAEADRELDTYFGRVFRKATDATPVTARLIARRPKAARAELAVTAGQLAAKLGRMPKVAELLTAHEKREVRALRLRGIKPPTPGTGKPAAPAAGPAAKPGAKPAAGAKPAKPGADTEADETAIPSIADLVRELSAQPN